MANRPLPRPVTATDQYLAALLEEIRGLRAEMQPPAPAPPPDDLVAIREPAPPLGTPLPDDFPGKLALEEAGIVYLESVPADGDELVKIKGIGRVTAGQILAELS